MKNWKLSSAMALVAATAIAATTVGASAQGAPDDMSMMRRAKKTHGSASRNMPARPLTVARPAGPSMNPLTAPIGLAGTIATAPLNGLSQAFGYGPIGGPSKPLPIVARYAGAGPVTDSVNQGWAQPVPLSANGPIYKLEPVSNSGGVSPFVLIAAPITAATTLAAAPINAAGSLLGAPPAPAPVF